MVRLNRRITVDGESIPLKPVILMYLRSIDNAMPSKEDFEASTVRGETWKLQTTSESLWITTDDKTLETYIALKFS